jgi:hypothetical protein
MTTIAFDTLKFANTLKAAGVLPAQAEAEAAALAEVLEVNLKELATKADLMRETELIRRELDYKLIQLEQRLIIKLGTLMGLGIGLVAALVKLL